MSRIIIQQPALENYIQILVELNSISLLRYLLIALIWGNNKIVLEGYLYVCFVCRGIIIFRGDSNFPNLSTDIPKEQLHTVLGHNTQTRLHYNETLQIDNKRIFATTNLTDFTKIVYLLTLFLVENVKGYRNIVL